jgi:hypothetical protein
MVSNGSSMIVVKNEPDMLIQSTVGNLTKAGKFFSGSIFSLTGYQRGLSKHKNPRKT